MTVTPWQILNVTALLNWSCQVDKCLVVTVTPWQIPNVTVRCKLVLSGGQVSGRDCHTMADTECHGALLNWSCQVDVMSGRDCHTMADTECHGAL